MILGAREQPSANGSGSMYTLTLLNGMLRGDDSSK